MWYISHTTTGESVCFLAEKLRYTVGRMGADVELQDDICVSRAHAAFNLVNVNDRLNLEIEDLGSKYGTYLNKGIETNTPVEKGRKIALKHNDLIRFGRLQNIWKVQFMIIDTAMSSLSRDESQKLKSYIDALGGKISEQWSNSCSHLTMSEPSVTMKLLHALIEQKLVVTPAYWNDLLKTVKSVKSQLPKPELYRPDFGDENINFNNNIKRGSLFKGITFVFLNRKHFDMYSPIIKLAGGACKDLNSGVQKTFLIKDGVVVVQYTPSTQTESSQTISTIAEFLESNSKRVIPEYEIGLAILHCCIEKFCNPNFRMTQSMAMSSQIDLTDEQSTQSLNSEAIDLEIPETNENMITSTPYVNPDNINTNPKEETMSKMHITETPIENERKRKLMSADLDEGDDELFQFQSKKACTEDNTNGNEMGKSDEVSNEKENMPVEKVSTINVFLQKTQNKDKTQAGIQQSEEDPTTSRENRKRPLIQVLNENDEGDDDLFRFGDTQKAKKVRKDSGEEEDLFSFKEKESNESKRPLRTIDLDEDSSDMQPTQQFIIVEKVSKKPKIQMPKPKCLPRKISAIDWISSSFGKINIKKEHLNDLIKDENDTIKTESSEIKTEISDDINITEDHRKWVESIKNAIEIQQVSINISIKHGEKSHYKFKNRSNIQSGNITETVPNFKKFVKKYNIPSQNNSTVIKLHLR